MLSTINSILFFFMLAFVLYVVSCGRFFRLSKGAFEKCQEEVKKGNYAFEYYESHGLAVFHHGPGWCAPPILDPQNALAVLNAQHVLCCYPEGIDETIEKLQKIESGEYVRANEALREKYQLAILAFQHVKKVHVFKEKRGYMAFGVLPGLNLGLTFTINPFNYFFK